jgi:GTP-binding protein
VRNYEIIEAELKAYSEEVWSKPRIIALNKEDLLPPGEFQAVAARFAAFGVPLLPISAATGQGVEALRYELLKTVEAAQPEEAIPILVPKLRQDDSEWHVELYEEGFLVKGKRVERMVAMTNLDREEDLRYLERRLERVGVIDKLREAGAVEGDTVRIGDFAFSFTDES